MLGWMIHHLCFTCYHIIISASYLITSSLLCIISHHYFSFTSITSSLLYVNHIIISALYHIISHLHFTSYHCFTSYHIIISASHLSHHYLSFRIGCQVAILNHQRQNLVWFVALYILLVVNDISFGILVDCNVNFNLYRSKKVFANQCKFKKLTRMSVIRSLTFVLDHHNL